MTGAQFSKAARIVFLFLLLNSFLNAQKINIVPYPNNVELKDGQFTLSASTKIYYDKNCKNEAIFLQQLLMEEHNLKTQIAEKKPAASQLVIFILLAWTRIPCPPKNIN